MIPTRREHETYDLGPFTVRAGRMPPDGVEAMIERVARVIDPDCFNSLPGHGPGECDMCDDNRAYARRKAVDVLIATQIAWPPVIEFFFDQRGKVGTELNAFLHDAGVLISKVLQGKEPT